MKPPYIWLLINIFLLVNLNDQAESRIHHLVLSEDNREQVTISTFGFLKDGVLQVKLNKLAVDPSIKFDKVRNLVI